MWRRRWPTSPLPALVMVVVALVSLAPGTLTAPSDDLSLEDTARVLRHFSAGVSANRGAGARLTASRSHGNHRTQQPLSVRLDSVETPDNSREDPSDRESVEVTLGGSAASQGGRFSSQYFVVRDDDDDSLEIDEDDFRFMNLGRRYHPDGIAPTSPRQLFIPQPATIPAAAAPTAPRLTPSLNNPFIIATASSSEENDEDNPYEDDDDDDDLAIYLSKNLLTVKGDDSSEERLELDDALLGKRYNFIDGQGSVRWGYDLVDQYQHQTVKTDGTMEGRFGWTAPNGQEIKVQYVADDGGYRLIETSGIYPHDNGHRPSSSPGGVSLIPGDDSYKVTVPFGGAGVPLPDPSRDSGIFGSEGVPLPDPGRGSGSFGTGGVPLPSPSGPGISPAGSSFFGDEDTIIAGGGSGGVPLPGMSGAGGSTFLSPGTAGVPLPSPTGPGSSPSGSVFLGDDERVVVGGGGGGVALPGMSGAGGVSLFEQGRGGVPLPSPSGPGASPSGSVFLGDEETVVLGGTGGGVPLPGSLGAGGVSLSGPGGLGTGGVPIPSPSGPGVSPSGSGFFGDDETVVVGGAGGGVPLPGSLGAGGVSLSGPGGPEISGVPIPSPSGPGTSSDSVFLGDGETVVVGGAGGGVPLPGSSGAGGVSLSSPGDPGIGGVPLPSPSAPGAPSSSVFLGDDETVVFGGGGGVGLPGAPGPGGVSLSSPIGPQTVGVPIPSPSGPGVPPPGGAFLGDDQTVVFGGGGGVSLPGMSGTGVDSDVGIPGAPGLDAISLSSPGGPGLGGVPLPSPSVPGVPPGSVFFGDDETIGFGGGGGGVGLSGATGPGGDSLSSPSTPETGGVPLSSPTGPGASPSGSVLFGDDETVGFGVGGGVGLPGVSGPGPIGPSTTSFDAAGFGDSTTGFGATKPGLEPGARPVDAGVSLSGFDDSATGFGAFEPGTGTSGPGFEGGVSLPGFDSSGGPGAVQPGFDDSTGFGVSGPGTGASGPGLGEGGVSLPGFGSSDGTGAGISSFDDPTNKFGAPRPGFGPDAGTGGGISLPGSGSPAGTGLSFDDSISGFGAFGPGSGAPEPGFGGGGEGGGGGGGRGGGVSLPGFGLSDSSGFGVSGHGSVASGPGFGTEGGVSRPEFGSSAGPGVGGPGFDDSTTGFGSSGFDTAAPRPGFEGGGGVSLPGSGSFDSVGAADPGFDDSTTGFGAFGPGFDRGVPLSVIDSSGNLRPGSLDAGSSNAGFGSGGVSLSVSAGPFDNFGPSSLGFGSGDRVSHKGDNEFGGSAPASVAPGAPLHGHGKGGLDASEVPLQGPPVPGTFRITTNLGQDGGSSGVPINIAKDMSFNKIHPSHAAFPFFEVGPPEPVHQAAGGPTKASPFPHHPDSSVLDARPPKRFPSPSGPDPQPNLPAESSVNSGSESDKPQDLVKVYSEIYGIKMMSERLRSP